MPGALARKLIKLNPSGPGAVEPHRGEAYCEVRQLERDAAALGYHALQ